MREPAPDPPIPRWLVVSTAVLALVAPFFFLSPTPSILLGLSLALLAYAFLLVLVAYPLWMISCFLISFFRRSPSSEK